MNSKKLTTLAAGLIASFGYVGTAFPAATLSVDMIPGGAIDSVRMVSFGENFSVNLILTMDALGVANYSVSSRFDVTQLQLNPTIGGAAANFFPLCGGLSSISPPMENNALGQVYAFNGATLALGPVSTSCTVGTINFTAGMVLNDAIADITVGFFDNPGIIDAMYDNSFNSFTPTFEPGYLVPIPEPSTSTLFICGMLATWQVRRRWTLRGRNVGLL